MNDTKTTLIIIGQRLTARLRDRYGIERTPAQCADTLLVACGGFDFDAISNGYRYLSGRSNLEQFIAEVQYVFPVEFDQ